VSYLLDTNVISEWTKPRPDPRVIAWLAEVDEDRVFLSVVSLAEIRRGIELMPSGNRRDRLATWLVDELPARFESRVIPIDPAVAEAWGVIMARARRTGIGLGTMDAFIAATANVYELTLVTRNTADFERLALPLLNPWQPPV
jgi:predicted nucleic acid-binding protein